MNEIPSPWCWENYIYIQNGQCQEKELLQLFKIDRKLRRIDNPKKAMMMIWAHIMM